MRSVNLKLRYKLNSDLANSDVSFWYNYHHVARAKEKTSIYSCHAKKENSWNLQLWIPWSKCHSNCWIRKARANWIECWVYVFIITEHQDIKLSRIWNQRGRGVLYSKRMRVPTWNTLIQGLQCFISSSYPKNPHLSGLQNYQKPCRVIQSSNIIRIHRETRYWHLYRVPLGYHPKLKVYGKEVSQSRSIAGN